MGFAARCGAIPAVEASTAGAGGAPRATGAGFSAGSSVRFQGVAVLFRGNQGCPARGRGRRFLTVANAESNKCRPKLVGTPLEPESPAAKFLCGILNDHPHIFPVAATEQLEYLALERDSAIARRDCSSGSAESRLHERIAEMKERECQIAVEEVMYLLIFHRFCEIKVPMVSHLSRFMAGTLDTWPSEDEDLETIYNSEVLGMVRDHLSRVVGRMGAFDVAVNNQPETHVERLQLGRIYAASIMYGYFLKSVCLRHHLEHNLALTSKDYPLSYLVRMRCTGWGTQPKPDRHFATLTCCSEGAASSSLYPTVMRARRVKQLRSYVMGFDSATLQICAKLKSQEAANLIEKHSRALFLGGKGVDEEGEAVRITHSGTKRLVLEAVAFGTFLWDAERCIDCVYGLE